MTRVCPSCKENIGQMGDFFCFNCGKKLPDNLIGDSSSNRRTLIPAPPFIIKEEIVRIPASLIKKTIIICVLSVFGIGVLYLGGNYYLKRQNAPSLVETPDTKYLSYVLQDPSILPEFEFAGGLYAGLLPTQVDLYLEGSDWQKFINFAVKEGTSSAILSKNNLLKLFEGRFAFFSSQEFTDKDRRRVFGLIGHLKDKNLPALMEDSFKEASISSKLEEDAFVVTNSALLLKEIEDAKKRTVLNLSLNSNYASAKNDLPKKGRLYIITLSESGRKTLLDLESLGLSSGTFSEFLNFVKNNDLNGYIIE